MLVESRFVLTRLLWAFDFIEEPTERVDFDDFPVIKLIEKEALKMRVKISNAIMYKTAVNYVSYGGQGQYS